MGAKGSKISPTTTNERSRTINPIAAFSTTDLIEDVNFSTISFQKRTELLIRCIKNENYPLAFKAFLRNPDASYSDRSNLEEIIKNSGGFLSLLSISNRKDVFEISSLEEKLSPNNPNRKEAIRFFTNIFSIVRSDLKKRHENFTEDDNYLDSDQKNFETIEKKFISNLTKVLLGNDDIESMTFFYHSSDVDCRDQIELALARNIDVTENSSQEEKEAAFFRKGEFLNALITMESLIPTTSVLSPSIKIPASQLER